MEQVPALRANLERGSSSPAFVETVSQILQERFLEVIETCNEIARTMTYANRRNQATNNRRNNARTTYNNNGRRPYSEDSGIGMQALVESNQTWGWLAGTGTGFPPILPNNQAGLSRSPSQGSSHFANYSPYQPMVHQQLFNPYAATNPDAAANSIARVNYSFPQPPSQRSRVSISSEPLLRPAPNPHITTEMLQSVDPHTQLNVSDNLELHDDLILEPCQTPSLNPPPVSHFPSMGFANPMGLGSNEMQITDPQQVPVFPMADTTFMSDGIAGGGLQDAEHGPGDNDMRRLNM